MLPVGGMAFASGSSRDVLVRGTSKKVNGAMNCTEDFWSQAVGDWFFGVSIRRSFLHRGGFGHGGRIGPPSDLGGQRSLREQRGAQKFAALAGVPEMRLWAVAQRRVREQRSAKKIRGVSRSGGSSPAGLVHGWPQVGIVRLAAFALTFGCSVQCPALTWHSCDLRKFNPGHWFQSLRLL